MILWWIPPVRLFSSCACDTGLTYIILTKSAEKPRNIPRACWKCFLFCVFVLFTCHSSFPIQEPLPNNYNLNRLWNLPSQHWESAVLHGVRAVSFCVCLIVAIQFCALYVWQNVSAVFCFLTSLCYNQQGCDLKNNPFCWKCNINWSFEKNGISFHFTKMSLTTEDVMFISTRHKRLWEAFQNVRNWTLVITVWARCTQNVF